MSTTQERVKRLIPAVERLVSEDEKRFEELIPVDHSIEQMLGVPGAPETEEDRASARGFLAGVMRSTFRSLATMEELQQMAKSGVSNLLRALGYDARTDSILGGFSGNQYYVSVMAPTEKRVLIVDQSIDSAQLVGRWIKREPEVEKTFDESRVTMGDFFKFLDISKALGGKPAIYWLHDYTVEKEVTETLAGTLRNWPPTLQR